MKKYFFILFMLFLGTNLVFAQQSERGARIEVKGSVLAKESYAPISNVEVSTDKGAYTETNKQGEFSIIVSVGDELIFRKSDIETLRYIIKNDEDIKVLVSDYDSDSNAGLYKRTATKSVVTKHKSFIDSANHYKRIDIEKSIDFISQSISELGASANKKELALSLTTLGEVYQYYQQYDLAIENFKDAQIANKTTRTALLLGRIYILNNELDNARNTLEPLLDVKNMIPYQRTELYEGLGDVFKMQNSIDKAVAYYEEGLKVANKNQITPKVTDLNSKIADAYAKEGRSVEAEGYYNNSLKLARKEAPQRAIQEKEKVADFYNNKNRYDEEIKLRKNTLNELNSLPAPVVAQKSTIVGFDSITSQRINYKIGRAYIAQDKYEEAIPYLEKSIVEADREDDLIVQKDATRKLSELYESKGDFFKAYKTYQEYVAVVDTLYRRKEQEISRAARFNREISSRQSRISGLEQERELSQSKYALAVTEQQLVQESFKRQQWVIYSLIAGLVLMGLAAFFFYRSNQQQKLANNLLALKSLRSQMNPHFIFNALNSVNNYIAKSDERSANRFLSEFSTLMRSVLENSEEDFIPLSKELELLELYVKLEHSRFPDKFDYALEIDENIDVSEFEIPPMLLQPYIENAIWHGLRYKEDKGYLKIGLAKINKDCIQIIISDNGIGRKESAKLKTQNQKKQKSKGMGNIKKRVAILNDMYKDRIDVSIGDLETTGSGTKVILTLKKD
ncbi:histidine kinase [Aurantibacter crassamenti]|uniref:tetratricopeptide repeat-containing sensor histidine kinase n=1 Tax=Aurantibacter crassamenti TaxID=1837375 RepID=UPI00193968C3|nr:histidine kinase [Aurantibacter crassamenti]MBM1106017.1 histidine kinase [Aurantibacter crassamenti]